MLLQFSSGSLVSPFHFNGFSASLDFWERQTTTQPPVRTTVRPTEPAIVGEIIIRDKYWSLSED